MHTPTSPDLWQGRIDDQETGFAQRWHQRMSAGDGEPGATVLLGFACDAGVLRNHGRTGAATGPRAIRKLLANVPLGKPMQLADAGDIVCEGDALESAQSEYAATLASLLRGQRRVIGLGGGHEIAYAGFCGLLDAQQHAPHLPKVSAGDTAINEPEGEKRTPRIGIINFDAHFDLRADAQASSGTPFRQIAEHCAAHGHPFHYLPLGISRFANTAALFERARNLGLVWREDEAMNATDLPAIRYDVSRFISLVDVVYLTICLDVLPPEFAPGVSAPSARGVELAVIETLVDQITASGKLAYADLAELNPTFDIDNRTARIAARLVARIAEGWQ
jgi:formiminoglutamase